MCRVWQVGFGDDTDFVMRYLNAYDTPANRIVRRDSEGHIVALMHYHRFSAGQADGAYIYGVTTLPQWRGRGLARQMLHEAFEAMSREGIAFAMLIAEEPSLRQWYATMQFTLLDGITVEVTGSDGMNFGMDDSSLNVPMVRAIANDEAPAATPGDYLTSFPKKIIINTSDTRQ